jgi:exosortase E/protease (VPEID-CTERM system)
LAVHFAAFGGAWFATSTLFGGARASSVEAALLVTAALSGLAALVALMRAAFGRAAWQLSRALLRIALAGTLLGYAAWFAGVQSLPLWPHLAQSTLTVSAWLLRSLSSDVQVDAPSLTLSVRSFTAEIAPGCSGVEGMALVAVFVAGYIYRFRGRLHVARALLLLPVVVAMAWLANAARIAALVAIGAFGSPDIALGGFHSKAGWALFCALALSVVITLDRSSLFAKAEAGAKEPGVVDNPTAGYCLPFLALLGTGLVTSAFAGSMDLLYPLRLCTALGALYWLRAYHPGLRLSGSWSALLAGVAVFAAWLLLAPVDRATAATFQSELVALSPLTRWLWLACRLFGSVAVVSLVEELAFRGYLQRRLTQRDFSEVDYRQVSAWGIFGSALAFGLLHSAWLLGTFAGVAYSLVSVRRGRIADAAFAHGITNLLLGVWVLVFGRWDLLS